MPWIARDNDGKQSPYRLFGEKPIQAKFVNYDGDVQKESTWTLPKKPYIDDSDYNKFYSDPKRYEEKEITYKPFGNSENTTISEADCPIHLEPGEGPIEVGLVLKEMPKARIFEGAYI